MKNESVGEAVTVEEKMSTFATNIMNMKYAHTKSDGTKETWNEISYRVAKNVLGALEIEESDPRFAYIYSMISKKQFMPGGRYLYASGRSFHQTQNCLLLRAEDSREGWSEIMHKSSLALMTGAGIGIDYSAVRAEGSLISRTGGEATGPLSLMQIVNEIGRGIKQGRSRRSAIWAGLNWKHNDIFKFITIKNWSEDIKRLKEKDFDFPAPLDGTNISVILDKDFFDCYHDEKSQYHDHAMKVYKMTVAQMVTTSEPGFSVDYDNPRESLRNACTEVTSEDSDDICNLGSINMANINSLDEMQQIVDHSVLFLMAGTVYSHVPYSNVDVIRSKNRRLGLGLMGLHEWLAKRNKSYGPCEELAEYLECYKTSGVIANSVADQYGLSRPIKTRAIAPTGTIGILAETTTGIEPIFCVALKRRYLQGSDWKYEYIVDPTAKKLIDMGVDPSNIEDSYSLSKDVERRLKFQAWLQEYVDQGISSTINLPFWGSEFNNEKTRDEFEKILIKYLPKLRGMTCYADGSRGGQPLTPVDLNIALAQEGEVFYESTDVCDISRGGTCGS
jgi:ribonucleoside-diphosphate reductase alpha chain